ncbi:MAG: ABC transporter ATP-binding protein [Rhodospirillaceae bacterium]|nr:ABC transporter ATP-binding protein [Rhodospirillaceae bacterium]
MAVDERAGTLPLAITGVSAAYGKKQVLTDITFNVRPAEVFGLVGLNGAGKTTLIRSILNLRTSTGDISLFGAANTSAKARQNLIYLPERFSPPVQLKGFEYLSILLEYFGQRLERESAKTTAANLDLDPHALSRSVRTYSKGMGQKLGLIGSFLVDARLMVLDEPMSGLDPRARVFLKDRLMGARTAGRSVFFSSHILSDIEEICDRIGVLHGGRIIFLGAPRDFTTQYAAPSLERAFLAALERTDSPAPD